MDDFEDPQPILEAGSDSGHDTVTSDSMDLQQDDSTVKIDSRLFGLIQKEVSRQFGILKDEYSKEQEKMKAEIIDLRKEIRLLKQQSSKVPGSSSDPPKSDTHSQSPGSIPEMPAFSSESPEKSAIATSDLFDMEEIDHPWPDDLPIPDAEYDVPQQDLLPIPNITKSISVTKVVDPPRVKTPQPLLNACLKKTISENREY